MPSQTRDDSRPDTWRHIETVRGLLNGVAVNLLGRAHRHDQSKLVSPEVEVFDEFTPKLAESTYGSDEYKEFLKGMGVGLAHHYEANDHHPEHFDGGLADMGLLQLTEMLCDWIAATRRHNDGDIHRSIEQNAERFGYGHGIKRLLHNSVDQILSAEQPTTERTADHA